MYVLFFIHFLDKSENTSENCSNNLINNLKSQVAHIKALQRSMTQSDSGSFTTWSKLKKRTSDNQIRRQHTSGNNNESEDENSHYLNDNVLKSQSMPNLYKQKLKGLFASNYLKRHKINTSAVSIKLSNYLIFILLLPENYYSFLFHLRVNNLFVNKQI